MNAPTEHASPRRHGFAAILASALRNWWQGDSMRVGAALAYYSVFSLAPILVIAIAIGGAIFGVEAARGSVVAQFQGLLGREGSMMVQAAIESSSLQPGKSLAATLAREGGATERRRRVTNEVSLRASSADRKGIISPVLHGGPPPQSPGAGAGREFN